MKKMIIRNAELKDTETILDLLKKPLNCRAVEK